MTLVPLRLSAEQRTLAETALRRRIREQTHLGGHASSRQYIRLHLDDESTAMAMVLPEDALKSDEEESASRPSELPFLTTGRFLSKRGLRVPAVRCAHVDQLVVVLEDLGDEMFENRLLAHPGDLDFQTSAYRAAIDLLVDLQSKTNDAEEDPLIGQRGFDYELLRWELDHFREWGLEAPFGPLEASERTLLDDFFDKLADRLSALPQGFVHRDFQSRNLMIVGSDAGVIRRENLAIIDHQDALMGPPVYDLVALLCDSYVDLSEEFQEQMIAYFAEQKGAPLESIREPFWQQALQRKLKDSGRFIYIDRVRKNPDFLGYFPLSLRYVARAFERVEDGAEVRALIEKKIPGFPTSVAVPSSIL